MFVEKRDGRKEQVKFEKISKRIGRVCKDLKNVDGIQIAQKVIQGLFDGVSSRELDRLAIETSYSLSIKHPEYDKLAVRLAISGLHKDTKSTFSEVIEDLYKTVDAQGKPKQLISNEVYNFVKKHKKVLDASIDNQRDYDFDFFGFKTLERSYLLKTIQFENNKSIMKIAERPQYLYMRVAAGIHYDDVDAAVQTYHLLSTKQATHATPTLFNAGLVKNQLSSCFLVDGTKDDSINGIYDTLKECALISQSGGGLGISYHGIRSKNSPIFGTGGISNGIVPMLKVYQSTALYVDQCLEGNSLISTNNGAKKITELTVDNLVKNFNGNYSEIIETKSFDYSGEMIKIIFDDKTIQLTPNHPVLLLRNAANLSDEEIKIRISKCLLIPEWYSANEILENDICLGIKC